MYNGHADVTLLSNGSGEIVAKYYYDAFGEIIESSGSADNPIRYAGYQYDEETGLYYLNARMYDPTIARFLQEDTYTGDIKDPLSLNLYTYCHNNPLVYYDPTGHFLDTIFDVISVGVSVYEFIKEPSWSNGLALAADVGCAVLPFVSGGGKLVRGASKLVDKYSDFKKAKKAKKAVKAAKAVDKYKDVKKSKKTINILDDIVSTSQKTSRKLNKADKIQDTFNNLNKIDSLNAVDKLKAVDRLKDVEKTLDNTKSLSKLDNIKSLNKLDNSKNLPTKYDPDFAKFQESFTKNFEFKSGGINKGVGNPKSQRWLDAEAKLKKSAEGNISSGNIDFIGTENGVNIDMRDIMSDGKIPLSKLQQMVPQGTPNTFGSVPVSRIAEGYKYKFSQNGKNFELKWHSPDPDAAIRYPGSSSGGNWTAQIRMGKKQLLGSDGKFYNSANNLTHIIVDMLK